MGNHVEPAHGPVRRFVARHGWRAYALPVLAVITIAALLQPSEAHRAAASPPAAPAPHSSWPAAGPATPAPSSTTSTSTASTTAGPTPPTSTPVSIIADGTDSTACLRNTAAKFVLVSISQQHAWMCQRNVQVNSTAVTTGEVVDGNATPTGSWVVQDKQTDRYLTGPGYRDYVHFWIPFNGDFGFHDATWQTMPFGSPGYRTNGSHGCVHLPMTVVQWLYGWAQIGSTVVTVVA